MISGFSQGELAELVGITPAQMSLYLTRKSSLSHETLEKILAQMDINLECYSKRLDLARQTAKALKNKIPPTEVISLQKEEMITLSGIKEISHLIEVQSSEEFNAAISSGLMDADAYYVHFRMIVAHLMQLSEGEITTKKASQSVSVLNKATGTVLLTALGAIGVGAVIALAQKATGISGRPTGIFSSFTALASESLMKKIK